MKFITFIATVVLLATVIQAELSDDEKKAFREKRQHCLDEAKIPYDRVQKFNQRQYDDNDHELRQYIICFLKTTNTMDEHGNFEKEKVRPHLIAIIGEEKAEKVLNECMVKKDTVEETVWHYSKCCHKYWPENLAAY